MNEQVITEVVLEHEQFFLERVLCFHPVLMLDGLLPHSHEFPLLEFLEEVKFFDVVVRITLNQPLAKGKELNWHIIFVQSQAFARESVVLLFWLVAFSSVRV